MSMNRHEPFQELISASLRNDITKEERERLDRHLDSCAECRATLAAFSDQRRIVAGLRHVAPPRDMSSRIRAGIERKAMSRPWWRRPQIAFAGIGGSLALVAGALLAFVLLNGGPNNPVAQGSATASTDVHASGSPLPTLPPPPTAGPSIEPPSPSAAPSQAQAASPEPQLFLALTGPVDDQVLAVRDGSTGETTVVDTPSGEPIVAELSPDGQWLAYITVLGETGLHEVRATRISEGAPDPDPSAPIDSPIEVGDTVVLGESVSGSPFLEHLFWSPESRYLAFTLINPDGGGSDVWIFQPGTGDVAQRTDVGTAYAGSWAFEGSGSSGLWVSLAGATPHSYLMEWHDDAATITPADPRDSDFPPAENVFQPIVSPDGALVIFWSGRMDRVGEEWLFVEGGAPWLAENTADGAGGFEFTSSRELFSDVTIGRDAFASAAITWGPDSDAYAVWDAAWEGRPHGSSEVPYPDRARVYLGHALAVGGLQANQAIDVEDIPADSFVVDVKVSPTGRHLVITAARPRSGTFDPPRSDLLLVTRNTGRVADEVERLGSATDGWYGPAAFGEAR
jgi:hypothetical protein